MKHIIQIILFSICFLNCETQPDPTTFSEAALSDTFITLEGDTVTFDALLNTYKGKTILLDVWATWCRDCIVGLPNLKTLQKDHPDVVYLFLSLDKSQQSWKSGIEKYAIEGEHYFMASGWEGDFGNFIDLDWVPRYMVIDPNGHIKLFKAIKANDKQIALHLKNLRD